MSPHPKPRAHRTTRRRVEDQTLEPLPPAGVQPRVGVQEEERLALGQRRGLVGGLGVEAVGSVGGEAHAGAIAGDGADDVGAPLHRTPVGEPSDNVQKTDSGLTNPSLAAKRQG